MLKTLELLNSFQEQVLKDNVREYHRLCDQFMSNCLIALLFEYFYTKFTHSSNQAIEQLLHLFDGKH